MEHTEAVSTVADLLVRGHRLARDDQRREAGREHVALARQLARQLDVSVWDAIREAETRLGYPVWSPRYVEAGHE